MTGLPRAPRVANISQSRRASLAETITSTIVGFALSWLLLWFLAAWLFWPNDVESNTFVTICFTALSLVRGYAIRRLFNWFGARQAKPVVEKFPDHIPGKLTGKHPRSSDDYVAMDILRREVDDSVENITETLTGPQPNIFGDLKNSDK
jgi:hypothetical protein